MSTEPATMPPADAAPAAGEPMLSPMTGGKLIVDPAAGIALHFPPTAKPGELDSLERPFDPAKFRPEKDTLGRWKNANAGRKPAPKPETPAAPKPQPELPPPDFSDVKKILGEKAGGTLEGMADEIARAKENPTAETLIGIIQTALMLIGDEEGILTKTEKEMLRGPLVRVLAKYEIGDDALPPEADLLFAVLGLIAARLQKPKTATKWVMFKTWIVGKFFAAKGRALASDLRREAPLPAPAS